MIVHLDTCGCVLAIGSDGEPYAFEGNPCDRHAGATVADVVAACRAKNVAMAQAGAVDGLVWGHDEDGNAHAGTVDFMSGQLDVMATCPPVTLEEYVAAIEAI